VMRPHRILVADDEPNIRKIVSSYLRADGFDVVEAADGDAALAAFDRSHPDLVILDVMMPNRDGVEVLSELRRRSDVYVIMLTARTHEDEKVLGLELGADDYVTKPFSPRELRARIQAVLRRVADVSRGTYRFGDCEVDFDRAEIRRGGRPVDVTALEFRLLRTLIRCRGRVLTREQLIQQAWEPDTYLGDRVVDTHILNLRKKIEPAPARPQFLHSVRGIGYRFDG